MARAAKQSPTEKAAPKQNDDPTIRIVPGAAPEYPEGTHPIAPPSEQTWGPDRFSYSDLADEQKPDESTIAQQLDSDPIADAAEEAREQDAADVAKQNSE